MTNVPPQPVSHPSWCGRQDCTVTAESPGGSHRSRSVWLNPEDHEPLYLRVFLAQQARPLGLPILVWLEGYDEDPAKARSPYALLVLTTRQAAIVAHLLRRLVQRARA